MSKQEVRGLDGFGSSCVWTCDLCNKRVKSRNCSIAPNGWLDTNYAELDYQSYQFCSATHEQEFLSTGTVGATTLYPRRIIRPMSQTFYKGDRVQVADDYPWAKSATGIIVSLGPREIGKKGIKLYTVEFDQAQYDEQGTGPYKEAEINSSALRLISEGPLRS